ncbi:hypothetical protein [Crocinitomix catalasitica]|uniref:hypothetical protein n=1 Tax=Crocinitomix catalasitica TaxID=184607 RepID=UPI000483AEEB|nr:hypothetical protein [Crocinitomix catalasitica]
MKNKYKIVTVLGMVLIGLYFYDPSFLRTLKFDKFEVDYNWRIFNNSYCNKKTHGHCATNDFNKINAEISLVKKLVENYDGQSNYKIKIEETVRNNGWLSIRYSKLTDDAEVNIDSLIKYKDEVFVNMWIK